MSNASVFSPYTIFVVGTEQFRAGESSQKSSREQLNHHKINKK